MPGFTTFHKFYDNMATPSPLVEMRNICKNFGGLQALNDAHLDLYPGEVVGVLGHNGAGKTTLMKVLAGAQAATSGEIRIESQNVTIKNPTDARSYGIETIYQELALCSNLDAPANLFMGREKNKWGFLLKREMKRETEKALSKLGIRIKSVDSNVETMSGGQRQSISIGRAVHFDAKIIIMDEPTAALGIEESKKVIELICDLKSHGIGILWISHDIHDVYNFTDRIVIFHGGRNVINAKTKDFTQNEIVSMIISGLPIIKDASK